MHCMSLSQKMVMIELGMVEDVIEKKQFFGHSDRGKAKKGFTKHFLVDIGLIVA